MTDLFSAQCANPSPSEEWLTVKWESLRTLMCEAEAIINSRPLTVDLLNDPLSLNLPMPNLLLTMKTKIFLPPPGVVQSTDKYCRKRWR